MLRSGAGLRGQHHPDPGVGRAQARDRRVRARGAGQLREGQVVARVEGGEPLLGDRLRGGAGADQGRGEGRGVRPALREAVPGAGGVHEEALLGPAGALDVQHLAVGGAARVVEQSGLAVGEDERRRLDAPAVAAGLLADGPALGLARVLLRGEPVGGVGDADDGAARGFARVEHLVLDLDDLELLRVEEEPGGGQVQHGVQPGLVLAADPGGQDHVPGRRLLADDDGGAGRVPALGRLWSEHAPGSEAGDHERPDHDPGHDGAQRPGGALLGAGGRGLQERGHRAPLREGVRVELITS